MLVLRGAQHPTDKPRLKDWVKKKTKQNKTAQTFGQLASKTGWKGGSCTPTASRHCSGLASENGRVWRWLAGPKSVGNYCGFCWPTCCLREVMSHRAVSATATAPTTSILLISVLLTVSLLSWPACWHPTLLQNNGLWLKLVLVG